MSDTAPAIKTFSYRAQTREGLPVLGTLDAADHAEAQRLLAAMRLQVIEVSGSDRQPKTSPLSGEDFLSFNQQLAYLTRAGLPVERGLRLIAQEARSPRMAATIRQIADDAERGVPLGEAFGSRRGKFPPLYGRLIDAGVQANNLPAMLFNLGRHMELIQRLRTTVWRAVAYPLVVLGALAFVLMLLGAFVLPKFQDIYRDFGTTLPAMTQFLLASIPWIPWIAGALAVMVIGGPMIWRAQLWGVDQFVVDAVLVLPIPLLGPVLRRNFIARWCDAVRLGVEAGLDLPAAIRLAGDAIGSPSLRADGETLIFGLGSSGRLSESGKLFMLTDTVTTAIDLASDGRNLPSTLGSLSQMYQQPGRVPPGCHERIDGPDHARGARRDARIRHRGSFPAAHETH